MTSQGIQNLGALPADYLMRLYRRHVQGALVRSGASLVMWLFALIAFLEGIIKSNHILGISFAVTFLILMNLPTLWALKHTTRIGLIKNISLLINILEIIGYTAIIYFLGGIEATYLIVLYVALITYVGVVAPRTLPFILAGICSFFFTLTVILEEWGFLPPQKVFSGFYLSWENQLFLLFASIGLLSVVAFISSYTANLLRKNKEKLHQKNANLTQTNERLQKEISERERIESSLKEAKAAAERANRAKSEFLANMSHELRTPLNHILGFTELVANKQCGDLNQEQEEYLNDVLQSSQHLLALINDILDLSKVEAGKLKLEETDLNLRGLLESSLTMVKEKALKHRIQLMTSIDGLPEAVKADDRKFKQILYNLLSNAVKFTPDGGSVTLAAHYLRAKDGQWVNREGESVGLILDGDDQLLRRGGLIDISIQDTGIGIKREDLQRIFEPFEQLDSSASRRYQGTGLGLALTKKMVELHGGKIWAESAGEEKGSKFTFVIPG
ncbi:MAG: ATP-binding protein [Deltaproteobacteria bacterium]|nr:ATP-binding protein [Deltaproteobacteria bacterium]